MVDQKYSLFHRNLTPDSARVDAQESISWSPRVRNAVFPDARSAIQRKCSYDRIDDWINVPRQTLANVGESFVEPSWFGRLVKHVLRALSSSASRTLTESGVFLPLLAVSSLVSVANAVSDVSLELEPLAEVPQSPLGLASMIFMTVLYTSVVAFMSRQCETRTQSLLLLAFLQLLAYISSLGAQDGQWVWLLCRFLEIMGFFLPLLGSRIQHTGRSADVSENEGSALPFRAHGGCQNCGNSACPGCSSGPSSGNEDQV
ncbi:hypothetical protein BGZ57DRAFT_310108 [Hyaloscypha finlandica]|nr:hypothetical protein BGZ57DRAFT_310108 [Hyaloscypha finlandica]